MMDYAKVVGQADPQIFKKISQHFENEIKGVEGSEQQVARNETQVLGLKKVEQEDYSDEYSHPYFKPI